VSLSPRPIFAGSRPGSRAAGFAHVSVIDAKGASDAAVVRLE
jgi:hypothetical protein